MAKYATFNYGDCTVYGTGTFAVAQVDILAKDTIELFFSAPVVVDDAYSDKNSYVITRGDSTGILNVRKVLAPQDGTLVTSSVILHIDKAEIGIDYEVGVVGPVATASGGYTSCTRGAFTGKATKADSTLSVIPKHYDNRPGSTIRAMVQALANQDELIGGDLNG